MSRTPRFIPPLAALRPALIVFDKDGTLIDFESMWAGWMTELAHSLQTAAGAPVANALFTAMDFDPNTGQIDPTGELALTPMAGLQAICGSVLRAAGLPAHSAEQVVSSVWHLPDPVALARPITDLALLFGALRELGAKIAVATSDDRAPTETLLAALNVAPLVDAVICADDGVPIKPAPDMLLAVCRRLNVNCAQTVMVGDNLPDVQMGRAAGAGLVVGVLSGVGSRQMLASHADLLLPDVDGLLQP